MKKHKHLLILLFSLVISISVAQTKTASKLGKSSKYSHNDSIMCGKTWHPTLSDEWGVVTPPREKNKNDMLQMGLDGKYNLVLFGEKKSGTWSRGGQFIYFTDEASGQKFNYKILDVTPGKIKVEYRDGEETRISFEMEPK